MRWITGTNERYLKNMLPYLGSLREHRRIPVTLVTVGFAAEPQGDKWLDTVSMTKEQNAGAPPETECIQHGSFLNVINGKDDEVLIYTDGDMIMQRQITDDELRSVSSIADNQVVTSYNSGPQECLLHEASRLRPRVDLQQVINDWGNVVTERNCYNVGVLIARRSTWKRIYSEYMGNWERVCRYFDHQARQQWLISYVIASLGIDAFVLPYSFHSHGHYGPPPNCSTQDGKVYTGEDMILLRHKL